MPDLTPVEGDPFGVQLTPVDKNPFAVGLTPIDGNPFYEPASGEFSEKMGNVASGLSKQIGGFVGSAATLPGDVAQGNTPIRDASGQINPEVIGRSADLAGLVSGGSFAAPAERDALGAGIRAFHGSPHDFDAFDMSKIGTGEGAQVYGSGLYFAENPKTAKAYRDALE